MFRKQCSSNLIVISLSVKFLFYACECSAYMLSVYQVLQRPNRVLDPLRLDSQNVTRFQMGAASQTWVIWKNSEHS